MKTIVVVVASAVMLASGAFWVALFYMVWERFLQ